MSCIAGYTGGVFDMFHVGHLNLLIEAHKQCDHLIVGVSTDKLCLSYKGKLPVIPYEDRFKIISFIKIVDFAVCQKTIDHIVNWDKHKFNKLFIGDDWKGSDRWNEWERLLTPKGIEIIYLPYTHKISSTILRERTSYEKRS